MIGAVVDLYTDSLSWTHRYHNDGFAIPPFRLSAKRVYELQMAFARLLQNNPNIRTEELAGVHIPKKGPQGIVGERAFLDLACSSEIVDLVAKLIGPDVLLWGAAVVCKQAKYGLEVPWHQDAYFWWAVKPLKACTLWIALDDCTKENGCIRMIPGSHQKNQVLEHTLDPNPNLVPNRRTQVSSWDTKRAVEIELLSGQMVVHDAFTLHGSPANRSSRRRAGLAIRYMPSTSYLDRSMAPVLKDWPLFLVRGQNLARQNDPVQEAGEVGDWGYPDIVKV